MTDYSWYKGVDLVFPTKPRKPIRPDSDNAADYRNYADKLEAYETAKAEYDLLVTEYWRKINQRRDRFFSDIRRPGLTGAEHNIILNHAWEKSHDKGFEAVEATYDEIVDLYKKLYEVNNSA